MAFADVCAQLLAYDTGGYGPPVVLTHGDARVLDGPDDVRTRGARFGRTAVILVRSSGTTGTAFGMSLTLITSTPMPGSKSWFEISPIPACSSG